MDMPDVVQNGAPQPTVEGLDLMDITREGLTLGSAPTPLLDTGEGNATAPTSPNRNPTRDGKARLLDLPLERALRSASPVVQSPSSKGGESPPQTNCSRRAFSCYKNPTPVEAVYERIIDFDPQRGYKVRWYQCGPEEDT